MDGRTCASRGDAERDREFIAATVMKRKMAASDAMKRLRSGEAPTLPNGPGSASTTIHNIGADKLASKSAPELRRLVDQTPGITRRHQNAKGKLVIKSCKELKEGLLALKREPVRAVTQDLPGRDIADSIKAKMPVSDSIKSRCTKKRPASTNIAPRALLGRPASKKRPAAFRGQALPAVMATPG